MVLMFYNISNHPSSKWEYGQLLAARALGGDVRDVAFPHVPPMACESQVKELVRDLLSPLLVNRRREDGDVFMVQGEFSLTYMATRLLLSVGRKVVVACTDRTVWRRELGEGRVEKTSFFKFVQFREVVEPPLMKWVV
jgi:hypothetical protein